MCGLEWRYPLVLPDLPAPGVVCREGHFGVSIEFIEELSKVPDTTIYVMLRVEAVFHPKGFCRCGHELH